MMVSQYNFFKNLAWDQFEGNFNDIYELKESYGTAFDGNMLINMLISPM